MKVGSFMEVQISKAWYSAVFVLSILIQYSCNSEESINLTTRNASTLDSATTQSTEVDFIAIDTLPNIKYTILIVNDSIRKTLGVTFEMAELKIIEVLNRIDVDRLNRLDSLIIPDSFYVDLNKYSPFPFSLSKADSIDKLILISYKLQAFAGYDRGTLVRWGPVSMGKKSTQTPTGLFHTNWKSKSQISSDNSDWILPWYFNLVNATGVSLHEFELPGYPASHSCIRLRTEDAQWLYAYAEQWKLDKKGWNILLEGTPVIIFGNYLYSQPKPWYSLAADSESNRISVDALNAEVTPFYERIIFEQGKRIKFNSDTCIHIKNTITQEI